MLISRGMTLAEVKDQNNTEITAITGTETQMARFFELGLYVGLEVSVQRKVAFGGPFIIQVGPGCVALREDEALCIQVQTKK